MAEADVKRCDFPECGKLILPEPDLWDRQGQPVEIRFAAYSQEMDLCSEHLALLDRWRTIGKRRLRGTVPQADAHRYMPFKR